MQARKRSIGCVTLTLLPMAVGGCALTSIIPTIAVPLILTGALAQILVQAGTPATQSGSLSFESPDAVNIGRGSLEIQADAIRLSSSTIGKINTLAQQTQEACLAACGTAGVDSDTCGAVCTSGQLQITVWVAGADDIGTVCTGGARDTYGPYLVTLDENGNGVSVSPSSVTLKALTLELMNQGNLSICLEVISPEDGEVLISELTANVGL